MQNYGQGHYAGMCENILKFNSGQSFKCPEWHSIHLEISWI